MLPQKLPIFRRHDGVEVDDGAFEVDVTGEDFVEVEGALVVVMIELVIVDGFEELVGTELAEDEPASDEVELVADELDSGFVDAELDTLVDVALVDIETGVAMLLKDRYQLASLSPKHSLRAYQQCFV